jgi:hypothetical protein
VNSHSFDHYIYGPDNLSESAKCKINNDTSKTTTNVRIYDVQGFNLFMVKNLLGKASIVLVFFDHKSSSDVVNMVKEINKLEYLKFRLYFMRNSSDLHLGDKNIISKTLKLVERTPENEDYESKNVTFISAKANKKYEKDKGGLLEIVDNLDVWFWNEIRSVKFTKQCSLRKKIVRQMKKLFTKNKQIKHQKSLLPKINPNHQENI